MISSLGSRRGGDAPSLSCLDGPQNPDGQEGTPWSRVSRPSSSASPPSGLPCCHPTRVAPRAARSVISRGATGCSRRSRPGRSSGDRCCTATPPAVIGPSGRAYGSVRRHPVQPARTSRGASAPASSSASEPRCSAPPWTTGGGRAIARFSLRARGARCLPLRPCRRRSGNRRHSGRGVDGP